MHILIIEDSPDDRANIRRMLLRGSDRPYYFTEAELGVAGARAYREAAATPPDCVLLDYHLPDMNAPEVLAELRNGSSGRPRRETCARRSTRLCTPGCV
jgi:CheY-like chemotaxis protein